MTELYDQDAGQPSYPAVDRRSAFRREADRGIIAEQRETIKLLEGRLAMRDAEIERLQHSVDNWERWANNLPPRRGGDS